MNKDRKSHYEMVHGVKLPSGESFKTTCPVCKRIMARKNLLRHMNSHGKEEAKKTKGKGKDKEKAKKGKK